MITGTDDQQGGTSGADSVLIAQNRERIAIIGGGPTGTYLCYALARGTVPCDVTVFEASSLAGPGTPYNVELNGEDLLANIAGVEIPHLSQSINAWALTQPSHRLAEWGISDCAGDDRAFFPRVVLGAWFAEELAALVAAPPPHIRIDIRTNTHVDDVVAARSGSRVVWSAGSERGEEYFDRVVLATGYGNVTTAEGVIQQVASSDPARSVLVLGSSLSGVDAAVAMANLRGEFTGEESELRYQGDTDWRITLASRGGVLPEADFWFPMPPERLDLFVADRLNAFVSGRDGDLDTVFQLFAGQLERHDPEYADRIGLAALTADTFADAYFAERHARDPFYHAAQNLAEAIASHRARKTIPWRYAILLMHEAFAAIVPRLSAADLSRFESGLKRVFTDNYAAVPHLSIARLIAMYDADVLDVTALGDDYRLERNDVGMWHLQTAAGSAIYDEVIDARGQRPVGLDDLPFPTLRMQVCAQAKASDVAWRDGINPGLDLTLETIDAGLQQIHFLALPFLLKRRPFVQGLVDCADMAGQVAKAVEAKFYEQPPAVEDELREMIARIENTDLVLSGGSEVLEFASEDIAA